MAHAGPLLPRLQLERDDRVRVGDDLEVAAFRGRQLQRDGELAHAEAAAEAGALDGEHGGVRLVDVVGLLLHHRVLQDVGHLHAGPAAHHHGRLLPLGPVRVHREQQQRPVVRPPLLPLHQRQRQLRPAGHGHGVVLPGHQRRVEHERHRVHKPGALDGQRLVVRALVEQVDRARDREAGGVRLRVPDHVRDLHARRGARLQGHLAGARVDTQHAQVAGGLAPGRVQGQLQHHGGAVEHGDGVLLPVGQRGRGGQQRPLAHHEPLAGHRQVVRVRLPQLRVLRGDGGVLVHGGDGAAALGGGGAQRHPARAAVRRQHRQRPRQLPHVLAPLDARVQLQREAVGRGRDGGVVGPGPAQVVVEAQLGALWVEPGAGNHDSGCALIDGLLVRHHLDAMPVQVSLHFRNPDALRGGAELEQAAAAVDAGQDQRARLLPPGPAALQHHQDLVIAVLSDGVVCALGQLRVEDERVHLGQRGAVDGQRGRALVVDHLAGLRDRGCADHAGDGHRASELVCSINFKGTQVQRNLGLLLRNLRPLSL
mmetsp:Transcript_14502/g.22440  ORF Transcript_14502/g.22440 Transcript_14502/m.22440 type:complete len:538 (-) Transcript_14502:359-1972(-)